MNRHGLLRRGGWLWVVVPSVLAALILSGFAELRGPGNGGAALSRTLFGIAAALLIALPVELVIRELVVVHRARRISVTPRYTSVRTHHHGGVGQLVLLLVVSLGLGLGGIFIGIDKQMLRHDTQVVATVQRSTETCGRSCSDDSFVSFTVGSRHYSGVDVDDSTKRAVGYRLPIFVDPNDPSDNVRTDDHGWLDFIFGGLGIVVAIGLGVGLIGHSRHTRSHRGMRFPRS